eukprot:6213378-Pleurochrysis_carterae.AAC.1
MSQSSGQCEIPGFVVSQDAHMEFVERHGLHGQNERYAEHRLYVQRCYRLLFDQQPVFFCIHVVVFHLYDSVLVVACCAAQGSADDEASSSLYDTSHTIIDADESMFHEAHENETRIIASRKRGISFRGHHRPDVSTNFLDVRGSEDPRQRQSHVVGRLRLIRNERRISGHHVQGVRPSMVSHSHEVRLQQHPSYTCAG